jgi:hypothetical protein|tara:strand:+ start:366 stop:1376 length:1011 start_codon:yes stop_codon:yes gene_type:complete
MVDSTATLEYAAEDTTADSHKHYDAGYKAAFAQIATLFEDIQADLRIITDRADDRSKGVYQRQADTVANNPANIAQAARDLVNLDQSGILNLVNAEVGNPTDLGNTSAANYNALRNTSNNAGGFVGGGAQNSQSSGYGGGESTAITGEDGVTYYEGSVPKDQLELKSGSGVGNVTYANSGKRNLPIQAELMNILKTAGTAAGVDIVITSGGQVPTSEGGVNGVNRTGSNRHDKGYAADIRVLDGDGTRLYTNNQAQLPILLKFVEECRNAGATAVGMGNGYMSNGNVHVDIAWKGQQAGVIAGILSNRYWGGSSPTNTAGAPRYLSDIMETRDNTA